MKTNNKQVRQQVRQHILECVYDENEQTYQTFEEAKARLTDEFNRVANHEYNLKRLPNNQDRFSDYLCGIPFHFEYTHQGIKDFLNGLGINPEGKEFDSDKSMRLYHYMIYKEVS